MFYCQRKKTSGGHAWKYVLTAQDAHNGALLWERPVKSHLGGKGGRRSGVGAQNVVATADRLYLALEPTGPLMALDAATGRTVRITSLSDRRRKELGLKEVKIVPMEELKKLFEP